MTSEVQKATANLASAGLVASPPTPRELQLAALNESLDAIQAYPLDAHHDVAVKALLARMDERQLRDLQRGMDDLDNDVAEELTRRGRG